MGDPPLPVNGLRKPGEEPAIAANGLSAGPTKTAVIIKNADQHQEGLEYVRPGDRQESADQGVGGYCNKC